MHASITNRTLSLTSLIAGATLLSAAALATPLSPGATIPLFGTTVAVHPNLAGVVVEDTIRPFSMTVFGTVYTGRVQDRVVRESATGTLDFYFRILLDQQWLQADRMMVWRANYPMAATGAGFSADVEYRTDGLGLFGPSLASRSSDGRIIGFLFDGVEIGPGSTDSTRFTYISTNAKNYDAKGWMTFQVAGGTVVHLPSYEPAH